MNREREVIYEMIEEREELVRTKHRETDKLYEVFDWHAWTHGASKLHEEIRDLYKEILLLKMVLLKVDEQTPVATGPLVEGDRVVATKTFVAEYNHDDDEGDDIVAKGTLGVVTAVYGADPLGVKFDGDSWVYVVSRQVLDRAAPNS